MSSAPTTTPTHEILCRYFANNVCQKGTSCPFSHDRTSKADRTCRYYLVGQCAYGTGCRYEHKRPPSADIRTVKNVSSTFEDSNASNNVIKAISSINSNGFAPMKAELRVEHVFSANAAEFVPSWKTAAPNESSIAPSSSQKLPLCPYFETGYCVKGDQCQFVHGDICDLCNIPCLHPNDREQRAQHRQECMDIHEAAMEEAFAQARSVGKVCGICMENIRERNGRFGILEGCKHCFCLECIRQWRRNQNSQFESKIVRSCPECRTHSDFVIPAIYWVEDQADKNKLIASFRENTKQKLCKYIRGGYIDDCPFGNKCFYKHQLPDGTVVEGNSPQSRRRQRRPLDSDF
ncbi:unnamed protein product [Thelazia callipaeda]|uniref:RING-type E3 ubiquitin transferase n=1 Tax=Thelazia callipaeda TaxID=103827 RepID=A0A0N5D037_THECL|nr:unnamed protein product [Thelazia callipaeda]